MNWHDDFGKMMLTTFLFLFLGGTVLYTCGMRVACHNACGPDRVNACYPDRVICVGTDKLYVKEIK